MKNVESETTTRILKGLVIQGHTLTPGLILLEDTGAIGFTHAAVFTAGDLGISHLALSLSAGAGGAAVGVIRSA